MSAKNYDLWLNSDRVLTISLDKASGGFPPDPEQQTAINNLIRELALAQTSCVYAALNDSSNDLQMQIEPINSIANAIVVLSQLSSAIQDQLAPEELEESEAES